MTFGFSCRVGIQRDVVRYIIRVNARTNSHARRGTYGTPLPAGAQSREDRPRSAVRGHALLAGSYRTGRGFLGLYAVRRGTAAAGSAERGLAREYRRHRGTAARTAPDSHSHLRRPGDAGFPIPSDVSIHRHGRTSSRTVRRLDRHRRTGDRSFEFDGFELARSSRVLRFRFVTTSRSSSFVKPEAVASFSLSRNLSILRRRRATQRNARPVRSRGRRPAQWSGPRSRRALAGLGGRPAAGAGNGERGAARLPVGVGNWGGRRTATAPRTLHSAISVQASAHRTSDTRSPRKKKGKHSPLRSTRTPHYRVASGSSRRDVPRQEVPTHINSELTQVQVPCRHVPAAGGRLGSRRRRGRGGAPGRQGSVPPLLEMPSSIRRVRVHEAPTSEAAAPAREVAPIVAHAAHSGPAHSGPAHSGPAHSGPAHPHARATHAGATHARAAHARATHS